MQIHIEPLVVRVEIPGFAVQRGQRVFVTFVGDEKDPDTVVCGRVYEVRVNKLLWLETHRVSEFFDLPIGELDQHIL